MSAVRFAAVMGSLVAAAALSAAAGAAASANAVAGAPSANAVAGAPLANAVDGSRAAAVAFAAAFPEASVTRADGGGWLTRASGFSARGMGATPEAAAMVFLAKYGRAFGVVRRERLIAHAAGGTVHVGRQIDGLPLLDGDLVVGLGADNAVVIVNSSVVPPRIAGAFRCSRKRAVRSAVTALPGKAAGDAPQVLQGWRANVRAIRPVWRVRLYGEPGVGEWSVDVDGETCVVMAKRSERVEQRP